MGDTENYEAKYEKDAESDVESVQAGDSASDVEAKIMGMPHATGVPSEIADDADESDIKA